MFKKLIPILFLLTAFAAFLLVGCDDSGNAPTGGTTGGNPNIQLKAGSVFTYGNDSIQINGTVNGTRLWTVDSVAAQLNWQGKDGFQINSVTKDSVTGFPVQNQTFYVSYDANSGKFYQWGIKKLFDPNQQETWDLVADFSQPLGTSVPLFTIDTLGGQSSVSATVSSTVQYDTTITTIVTGINVRCYKVAVVADVKAFGLSIGKVYLDYYIGYTPSSNTSNPSGRIRLKLYPINLTVYQGTGLDQKLRRFTIP